MTTKHRKSSEEAEDLGLNNQANDLLRRQGIYYITGEIEDGSLLEVQQDILLKHMSPYWTEDIQLVINSCGGYVPEGWSLIDLLEWVKMDVRTVGMGACESLGACLLACGTAGKRVAAPNCTVMVHGASTIMGGDKTQLMAQMKYILDEHKRDVKFWMEHSKFRNQKEVEKNLLNGKDIILTAEETLQYGIVDGIAGQPIVKEKGKKPIGKKGK